MSELDKIKEESMRRAIEEQKKHDPLIGIKIGSKDINQWIINVLKNENGVHIESFLTILGALAGYACQASVREEAGVSHLVPEEKAFTIAQGRDGKKYFFGALINKPLAEAEYSVWSLVAGAVQHLGKTPPDIEDIFKHVAATVGGNDFGIPRIPEDHFANELPLSYLKQIWPHLSPIAMNFCDKPSELPILFGLAIQEAIFMAKDVIDPTLAATIVMESAVPMSKVDINAS
jgi:hypothetical protein